MIKIITTYGQLLLLAMGRTLLLAFLGLIFACILGMIFGLLSVVKNKACNIIAQIFVFVIRGVPMIVLAFYVFFGIPYLLNTILGIGNGFTLSALQAGVICLALNCGAYMAEIIRAGIQSDPEHHQPVHHHRKGYLHSVRYRFSGAGSGCKECAGRYL